MADVAPQFNGQTEHRALCWIPPDGVYRNHEERHYAKLRPYFEVHQKLLDDFRSDLWDDSDRKKAYATAPTDAEKQALSEAFDELFFRTTGPDALDDRMALTRAKKKELLVSGDFPDVPLDNNLAFRDVREGVVKRKILGLSLPKSRMARVCLMVPKPGRSFGHY